MRVLTLTELMRLTRIELCALSARITSELAALPEGSIERATALINLGNIRTVLARRDFSCGCRRSGRRGRTAMRTVPGFC